MLLLLDLLLSLKEEDSCDMQVKTPYGIFRFLLHRTLPKEMAWFLPLSSSVGTFTAANQPLVPQG